ncbi:MAG: hypothetical protein QOI09_1609 [Chloroflexota bacterium]|jgi:hypothetical protein|nr:hypothetical protein [Chloroflexota bacterium]
MGDFPGANIDFIAIPRGSSATTLGSAGLLALATQDGKVHTAENGAQLAPNGPG